MGAPQLVAILISLAAVFAWINHRFLRLHPTVGIMFQSLIVSLLWRGIGVVWPGALAISRSLQVNLNEAVFHWMLGGLLFAGAMQVDWSELKKQWLAVGVLSLAGTVVSTFTVAGLAYWALRGSVPFIACAVFGAVISPTDPVAVLGFLKKIDAPREIEAIIGGESLFNDGVGVVLFTVLTAVAAGGGVHWAGVPGAFLVQTIGGVGVGLLGGWIVYRLLARVDNYQVEVLLTLSLAMGGYTLADALHVSGPIAAVVAGLIIGNRGRRSVVSENTRHHLEDFWELVEETLNAVLFLLVGLVVLQIDLHGKAPLLQGVAVVLVLFARWFSVVTCGFAVSLVDKTDRSLDRHQVAILTWGGLRGGLALAMALSLPRSDLNDRLTAAVFGVVVFSILVQGATLGVMFRRWLPVGEGNKDERRTSNVEL
jgi:CPA1 family monovalent cation:H+ antiporter